MDFNTLVLSTTGGLRLEESRVERDRFVEVTDVEGKLHARHGACL